MSGTMGAQADEDYIEVNGVKWPLPPAPPGEDEQGWDWGSLHFSPLEPFSPTTVAGDDTLVSDDRIAQLIFSDMRRGIGVPEYIESESLSGCQDSDLDTTQGIITLPTKKVAIGAGGALNAGFASGGLPIYGARINDNFGKWLLWAPNSTNAYVYQTGADAWAQVILTGQVTGFLSYGGLHVLVSATRVWTTPNMTTAWTGGWAVGTVGLCEHDGKLYTYRSGDGKIYWTNPAELASGVAWTGVSSLAVPLDPGEYVAQLLEWKDAFDVPCVTIITDRRVILYSDQDYFTTLFRTGHSNGRPYAHSWVRDDNLYLTDYPYSDTIWALDHQSIDEVSPNKLGGIQTNQRFTVSHLAGDFRHLYAFCPNRTGKAYPGRILKATEAFGWAGLNRGKLADPQDWDSAVVSPITGGAFGSGEVLTVYADGTTVVQQSPDRGDLAYNTDDLTYEAGPLWLVSAWTDCGLEDAAKIAAWLRVAAIRNDRTFGLPTGGTCSIKVEYDGSPPATYAPGSTYPATITLPDANQAGVPFVRMRWKIGLGCTVQTPIIRSLGLFYERAPDIYDGLQVPIDLSRARFERDDNLFYGLTRDDLLVQLEALKQSPGKVKRFYKVVLGVGNSQRTYKACDIRISGNIDPSTGYGTVVFTLRDVSSPPSGPYATEVVLP